MLSKFQTISPYDLHENTFQLIDKEWMLITAGKPDHYNMMTASWGGMGILWNKKVAFVFIRPQRYTYFFTEKYDYATLSFFDEKYRDVLQLCGTKSGKEIDKKNIPNLTPLYTSMNNVVFEQSRMFMECKKLYYQDINPKNFILSEIQKNYPLQDYHRMYIYEIMEIYKRDF